MMEKMVGDLVGEQFAKNQAHSSLSAGFQVTWQIRSKVGGYTQSSTRSIKKLQIHWFAIHEQHINDSMTLNQWDTTQSHFRSRPRRLRRKANPKKISMRSLSSKPSDGCGDIGTWTGSQELLAESTHDGKSQTWNYSN